VANVPLEPKVAVAVRLEETEPISPFALIRVVLRARLAEPERIRLPSDPRVAVPTIEEAEAKETVPVKSTVVVACKEERLDRTKEASDTNVACEAILTSEAFTKLGEALIVARESSSILLDKYREGVEDK